MLQVYYGNICLVENKEMFRLYFEKMNPQRKEKILRCKNEKDKQRSLLAGILLQDALRNKGIGPDVQQFAVNAYGRPYLIGREDICFNISHSYDMVVCVVSDQEVGIDIEHRLRIRERMKTSTFDRLVQHACTVEEYAAYQSCMKQGLAQQEEFFLKLWTRKESMSKAKGIGLGIGFSNLQVCVPEIEKQFCSKWLTEDVYVSLYQESAIQEVISWENRSSLLEE